MSNRLHLPNGVPQAPPQIQFQHGPNQSPVVINQQTPTGAIIGVIGGATRVEALAGHVAAGLVATDHQPEWIAKRAAEIARAILVEVHKPEPEQQP